MQDNIDNLFPLSAHRTQMPGKALRGVKNTIAIGSGKGGVGKSTVTANIAIALASMGARVGILDADIYGPSMPLLFPLQGQLEVVDDNKYEPVRAHGVQVMSIGYMAQDMPLIWRGPMLGKSLLQLIDITLWDELDYLFIDLPPGTGDIQLSLVQKIPLTAAVVVTTPQAMATNDALKAYQMFSRTNIDVLGIVENMASYICPNCQHEEALFGESGVADICNELKTMHLGSLPLNKDIAIACDNGEPSATNNDFVAEAFKKIAVNIATELAKRPLNYTGKIPPVVVE